MNVFCLFMSGGGEWLMHVRAYSVGQKQSAFEAREMIWSSEKSALFFFCCQSVKLIE